MENNKPEKLSRRPEVQDITGLSCSEIYKRMNEKTFPRPIKIGKNSVAWVQSEIHAWVQARIAEYRTSESSGV